MTSRQFIGDRLVVEPPRVKLSILRPFIREYGFLRREDFDSHPAHFAKRRALLLDVSVWPSEHLNDRALLSALVHAPLRDTGGLPDEVQWLKVDLPGLALVVSALDLHGEGRLEGRVHGLGGRVLETLFVEVVLHFGDAGVQPATDFHGG